MIHTYKAIANSQFEAGFDFFRMEQPLFESVYPPSPSLHHHPEWKKLLDYITVDEKEYKDLAKIYFEIGQHLTSNAFCSVQSQGSVKNQTLIKQVGNNNFDLDLIGTWNHDSPREDPIFFFEQAYDLLSPLGPLEKKNRCIRFICPNRAFYLELTPAIRYGQHFLVVDRETKTWKPSNPIAYASWFNNCALNCSVWNRRGFAFDSANIEPLPSHEVGPYDILRCAVRLFKRHRDRYYFHASDSRKKDKPISCIITTLTAQAMIGIVNYNAQNNHIFNEFELLVNCLRLMPAYIDESDGQFFVNNPKMLQENFAEKWNSNPRRKKEFDTWWLAAIKDFALIANERDSQKLKEHCKRIFGDYENTTSIPATSSAQTSMTGLA